jgi:hypothetical protein
MNLFTRGYPLPDDSYVIMRDVSDPASLDRRNKLFMATRQNWRRDTDTLPVRLSGPDRHARVGLMVGDDLAAAAKATTLEDVVLRLRVDQLSPEDRFDVTLNGAIVEGIRSTGMHDNRDAGEWGRRLLKSPWAWLEASLVSTLPKAGDNLISVRVLKRPARELTLNDIELSVRYNPLGKNGADIGRRTSDIPY